MSKDAWLILGNQLFPVEKYAKSTAKRVFMAEDHGLCTHFEYHQHKLVLFLSAMRQHADQMRDAGFEVTYTALPEEAFFEDYEVKLQRFLEAEAITKLHTFEIEDKFFEKRMSKLAEDQEVELVVHESPGFLVSRDAFKSYLEQTKKPFMKTFYEDQRRKLGILMDDEGEPVGGKYSFDEENRKKLPRKKQIPEMPDHELSETDKTVMALVAEHFSDHPGDAENFWLPTNRADALQWMKAWLASKFAEFGTYQDAISQRDPFLFHGVLSPSINLGLLLPEDVIDAAESFAEDHDVPMNSREGFLRQVMGWREFVRGIYQNFSEEQDSSNFWDHQRNFGTAWFEAETEIPVLDDALRKAETYGYGHHIERLMVLCNLMLLSEIHPERVHAWFMERYVDSSDWVMGPNVYGMGLFSDGGIFATKPYICGSNYLLKMSDYSKGDWCDIVDGLYWRFVNKHREFFKSNHRMAMMVSMLDRMDDARKEHIFACAETWLDRVTVPLK